MKSLVDVLNESLVAEGLEPFRTATSYSTNPPLEIDGIDRCDFSISRYLEELLDEEENLDKKKANKYKEFLNKNADLLDDLFVMYVDQRFGYRTFIFLVLRRHKDGDNETYYVMTPPKGIVDILEWLKSNLSKSVTFAKRYTTYR